MGQTSMTGQKVSLSDHPFTWGHFAPEKWGHFGPERWGHFTPQRWGHIGPEKWGHFAPEKWGHIRRNFHIEQLKCDIAPQGSIIAYNSTFEMEVLKRLAKTFPEDAGFINGLLARFQDLWVIFRSGWYYHPKMQSSTSIKAVLPAVTQSFDYSDLSISNGGMATTAFLDLIQGKNLDKRSETREALLRYCHRDTEAMVEIWRALKNRSPVCFYFSWP